MNVSLSFRAYCSSEPNGGNSNYDVFVDDVARAYSLCCYRVCRQTGGGAWIGEGHKCQGNWNNLFGLTAGTLYTVVVVTASGQHRSTSTEGQFYTSKSTTMSTVWTLVVGDSVVNIVGNHNRIFLTKTLVVIRIIFYICKTTETSDNLCTTRYTIPHMVQDVYFERKNKIYLRQSQKWLCYSLKTIQNINC